MHITKKEIFGQDKALSQSFNYIMNKKSDLNKFINEQDFKTITYIGSGSSYYLCKSAEISTKINTEIYANSLAAGDLMLNFSHYRELLKNTLLVVLSRSGNTTEVVKSVKKVKEDLNISTISISANRESKLSSVVDYDISIPWAFDESVCQTRTVTNLYMVQLLLLGILSENNNLIKEIEKAVEKEKQYINNWKGKLKKIGKNESWKKVVVLGDSELEGIASEAALAFKEIPQIPSNYHHILDVRHGPMVLIDNNTLIIMATTPFKLSYQQDLVNELMKKGGIVVTVGSQNKDDFSSDIHVNLPGYKNYGVFGIPFIFVPQVIAYYKAVVKNINPDKPENLDPWIEL